MDLSEAKARTHKRKSKKRVGRGTGSGMGKTCGRGHNGARSRSGWSQRGMYGGQLPLFRRLPKFGFSNARFATDYAVVNVGQLADLPADTEVTPELLEQEGLVKQRKGRGIKVLGKGKLDNALTVRAHAFSKSAREKIESAGGTVETVSGAGRTDPEEK